MEAELGERSPRIEINGRQVETLTRAVSAGGYVLTYSTVLPDRGIELHSTYTAHPRSACTLVSELFLCPQQGPVSEAREASSERREHVLHWRHSCFYDHLLRLQELLSDLPVGHVTIEELDRSLEALAP